MDLPATKRSVRKVGEKRDQFYLFTRAVATISWIDKASGLPETDPVAPPASITPDDIYSKVSFRFANLLTAHVIAGPDGIVTAWFGPDTGLYTRPSFLGIPSEKFPTKRSVVVSGKAIFRQTTGARTQAPEILGEIAGGRAGKELAEELSAFPPIWTEIELTIDKTGKMTHKLVGHSLFPSVSFYVCNIADSKQYGYTTLGLIYQYNGVPNLETWEKIGWGARVTSEGPSGGNPWNIPNPQGWGDNRGATSLGGFGGGSSGGGGGGTW